MSLLRCVAIVRGNMQPMQRLALFLLIASLVTSAPPARAAATGTIEGTVVNGTTDRPQRGVAVTLTKIGPQGDSRETVRTDRRGRYSFTGLRTGDDFVYALDASYRDGLFAGRPLTIPSDTEKRPVIDTTLRVFEPTTDPNAILIRRDDLFVVQHEDRVSVIEAVKVVNPTRNAYIGRGSALAPDDEGPTPSLGLALPDNALPETVRFVDADLDIPEVVEVQGFGFGITTAIPPGEVDLTFSYQVQGSGGTFDLSRTALYEISELSVFAAPPLEATSNRLEEAEELDLEGTTYRRSSSTESIDAADPIQILLVAEAGGSFPLVGGLGAGLAALILIGVAAFWRNKRPRPQAAAAPVDDRQELVTAIAELDLKHEAGQVSDAHHASARSELKARLARADRPSS
ncbi:MAG: carboxypeptidase-like regulatory domain-containing protein [Actinomycetota bacterium]|nr:carboxypeptidase-like regulatory domain-containing protein [Actinomycetota bacterium]